MASSKYIISPDKFFLDKKNRLMVKINRGIGGPDRIINQNLHALGRHDLNLLANITGIYTVRKWRKTLIKELTDKIEFQIPETLIEYKNDHILDKYADFPQIYIPLSKQSGYAFYYEFNNLSSKRKANISISMSVALSHGSNTTTIPSINGNVAKLWFTYPFHNGVPKSDLVLLCDEIKIMSKAEANNRSKNELIELLNDKFVLEERAS